jgi:hypothetical protein
MLLGEWETGTNKRPVKANHRSVQLQELVELDRERDFDYRRVRVVELL